jgi:ABC-type branched-subunit amino acid transport system substrate-binding protein
VGLAGVTSGPAAAYEQIIDGELAYYDMVNASGGVSGHKIVTKLLNTGYTPAGTLTTSEQLAKSKEFIVSGVASPAVTALVPFFRKNGTPWFPFTDGGTLQPVAKNIFGASPKYSSMGAYDAKTMWGLGSHKIGVLYEDDSVGIPGETGATQWLQKNELGTTPVTLGFTNTQTDFAPEIAQLQSDNVNGVVFWGLTPQFSAFMTAAAAANYDPTVLGFFGLAAPSTITVLGSLAENVYFSDFVQSNVASCSAGYSQAVTKYFGASIVGPLSEQGWGMGALIVGGLKGALQKGPLTRASFLKAVSTEHGLIGCTPNVSSLGQTHLASSEAMVLKVESGKLVQVAPFSKFPAT